MIKEGFYEDAIFRFVIDISEKFPKEIPKITFKNRIWHAMIAEDGALDLHSIFPDWNFDVGRQMIDILTKVRSIFSDKKFLEMHESFNPAAADQFTKEPEAFLERTLECAKKAKAEFSNLPEDCPYRFTHTQKISDKIKEVLDNPNMDKAEKKRKLKEEIESRIKENQPKK